MLIQLCRLPAPQAPFLFVFPVSGRVQQHDIKSRTVNRTRHMYPSVRNGRFPMSPHHYTRLPLHGFVLDFSGSQAQQMLSFGFPYAVGVDVKQIICEQIAQMESVLEDHEAESFLFRFQHSLVSSVLCGNLIEAVDCKKNTKYY